MLQNTQYLLKSQSDGFKDLSISISMTLLFLSKQASLLFPLPSALVWISPCNEKKTHFAILNCYFVRFWDFILRDEFNKRQNPISKWPSTPNEVVLYQILCGKPWCVEKGKAHLKRNVIGRLWWTDDQCRVYAVPSPKVSCEKAFHIMLSIAQCVFGQHIHCLCAGATRNGNGWILMAVCCDDRRRVHCVFFLTDIIQEKGKKHIVHYANNDANKLLGSSLWMQ